MYDVQLCNYCKVNEVTRLDKAYGLKMPNVSILNGALSKQCKRKKRVINPIKRVNIEQKLAL